MTPEFRAGERVVDCSLPCCECGKDSDAYAKFTETNEYICQECCEKNS